MHPDARLEYIDELMCEAPEYFLDGGLSIGGVVKECLSGYGIDDALKSRASPSAPDARKVADKTFHRHAELVSASTVSRGNVPERQSGC